jgi:thiol-disulfide isomerase/thioredoxin
MPIGVKQYFKKVIVQHPDTLIKEADHIIALSKPNKETYKFTIWYFTYETETSQIMGMDAVFVHLVNKYYKTGEAYWVNERVLKNITERADVLDKLLIGRPGPNMIMIDTNNNLKALYSLQADYTIIMFWDPDCGHCRTEIPEIRDWLKENEAIYNAKIFSVCSDTNLVKWKKFLHDYEITHWDNVNGTRSATKNYHDLYDIISTPTIYLLDKDKNILAKRLGYKQLIAFIERNHKLKSQKDNKD